MAKITTKELMDRYFSDELPPSTIKMRTNVDRKEMYAYLNKLSDQMGERVELVDLDVDQIYEMLLTYRKSSRPDIPQRERTDHWPRRHGGKCSPCEVPECAAACPAASEAGCRWW